MIDATMRGVTAVPSAVIQVGKVFRAACCEIVTLIITGGPPGTAIGMLAVGCVGVGDELGELEAVGVGVVEGMLLTVGSGLSGDDVAGGVGRDPFGWVTVGNATRLAIAAPARAVTTAITLVTNCTSVSRDLWTCRVGR